FSALEKISPAAVVHAHCDGPCGVYDPAQARVAAEAVVAMTKKILELKRPAAGGDPAADLAYFNTLTRYIRIKEDEAENAKHHLLVLWTDYFKPEHVAKFPDLHETFWMAAKAASACKHEISGEHAQELLAAVKKVHEMFWTTKNREVPWMTAVV
ncbi:MAG: superoxide dismutase, Ni, partial [Candidatus Kerfeldbacteria bacterium RIFCSPHIGHO2_12_FULL_48_17]